jgi:hypothetical protein
MGGMGGTAGMGGLGGTGGTAGMGGTGGTAGMGGTGGTAGMGGTGGTAGMGGTGGAAGMGGTGGAGGMPPMASCAAILAGDSTATNGVYTIDSDQSGPNPPVDTYCDMTNPIHGGGWTQLYDQNVNIVPGPGYLPTARWAEGVTNTPNGGQFSILQLTSDFDQCCGYEFLIDWDDRTYFVQWEQSENPFVGRGNVSNIVQSPTNQQGCPDFGGLGADGDGSSTLDGSDPDFDSRDDCWWWAIGTSAPSENGIPTYSASDGNADPLLSAMRTRLWVR